MGGGEVEQKLQCDRKPGELEVEQDSGLPRARHPRRHLAGSSHIEYDDRVGQCGEKVILVMLNLKHSGALCRTEMS